MYAALRRYEGVSDSHKTGELVDESFLPLMRKIRGFVAYCCVDAGTTGWTPATGWCFRRAHLTIRGARRNQCGWREARFATIPECFAIRTEVTTGEVVAHAAK